MRRKDKALLLAKDRDIKEYTYVKQLIYMIKMIKEEIRKLAAKSFAEISFAQGLV